MWVRATACQDTACVRLEVRLQWPQRGRQGLEEEASEGKEAGEETPASQEYYDQEKAFKCTNSAAI